jgi:hypothetical protein
MPKAEASRKSQKLSQMQGPVNFAGVAPTTTLVVLLGASEYPRAGLESIPAFAKSAQELRKYFLAADGYALPARNLLDRFDCPHEPSRILGDIADFLIVRQQEMRLESKASDLILYYSGHGGFTTRREYFLALRSTRREYEGATSLRMSDLASAIRQSARGLRRFLILDCCFSAASFMEFQSPPLSAARVQTIDALPREGTTLLCSSNARTVSVAPQGAKYTMFSGALIEVLREGAATMGEALSMEQVGALVNEIIRERYADEAVRPEVLSPDQSVEDIARIPIFPNPAARNASRRSREDDHEPFTRVAAVIPPIKKQIDKTHVPFWRRALLLYKPRRAAAWFPQVLALVLIAFLPIVVAANDDKSDGVAGAVGVFGAAMLVRAWAVTAEFWPRAGSSRNVFQRWTLFYRPRPLRGLTAHVLYWIFAIATLTGPVSMYREDADVGGAVGLGVMMLLSALAARGWALRYS